MNRLFLVVKEQMGNKDVLTLWMNNLLVIYAFLLPISQTIKATVFSFTVLLFIIRGDILKYLKVAFSNQVVRSFIYLFLIYVIGMLWTENLQEGLNVIKSIKYGLYLILFYTIVDGRYINKVISAFILGMLVSELTSYGMIFGIMPWKLQLGEVLFYTAYAVGDPSPFLHHIHYGVALAFVVILLLQKVFFTKETLPLKMFMTLFSITATINIFVTGGRTGYVTFFLLILILSILYLRKFALVLLLIMSLVFMTVYSKSPMFQKKVLQTKENMSKLLKDKPDFNTSIGTRVGLYYYAWEIVKKYPILGVGTGDSMNEIYKLTPKEYISIHAQPHEHNQYLSVLLKFGAVGLLAFFNIFYQIFRYKQKDRELRFIQVFVTLAIGIAIMTTQFNLRFFMPLWIVMLAVTLISRERKTIQNIELNDKKQTFEIIGVGALFSISSLLYQLL